MESALIGLLNGGISGFSLGHSDLGGYTSVSSPIKITRDKETLLRWIEMSAFSDAVMRSHPSNDPSKNWQIYDDAETAQFLAFFGKIHKALSAYKRELMAEACESGIPMVRSFLLEFPSDKTARKIYDQFMLGTEILVAPIFEEGSVQREVYFP